MLKLHQKDEKIFTLKQRCESVYGFTTIFRWSCQRMTVENGGGGGGGVEAPVERMRVERTVWENEKREKKKKWSELAERKWVVWKWVVENGG